MKDTFYELVLETYNANHLHGTALSGVINLIPKANRDTRRLKSLCPITLLNSDYKAIEKALANRIEPALESIINKDQRCFQKNRRISTNIRTIFELINISETKDWDNIILQLDFEKCFDKIEFEILHGALQFFGFSSPHTEVD